MIIMYRLQLMIRANNLPLKHLRGRHKSRSVWERESDPLFLAFTLGSVYLLFNDPYPNFFFGVFIRRMSVAQLETTSSMCLYPFSLFLKYLHVWPSAYNNLQVH